MVICKLLNQTWVVYLLFNFIFFCIRVLCFNLFSFLVVWHTNWQINRYNAQSLTIFSRFDLPSYFAKMLCAFVRHHFHLDNEDLHNCTADRTNLAKHYWPLHVLHCGTFQLCWMTWFLYLDLHFSPRSMFC